ncbi:MAG: glycoside hydrolase family 65 protein, partial [Bacteroidota bacterium]|nr:glycoside hydrolase family 65 protein [Bacteroidota bacterium]
MKNLFEIDEWKIIQNHFDPSKQLQAESIFSIGNGAFGQRANFEEFYSGETLQGSYLGGIYYPDKTKVGWWKNGYPEYFAKVLNSCNWIGIDFWIDGEKLDLNKQKASHFQKVLDMKNGTLQRTVTLNLENEKKVKLDFTRFCSMDNKSIGIVKATITPLNFNAKLNTNVYLNGKVYNNDANYDELFWDNEHTIADAFKGTVCTSTKKTKFIQSTAMEFSVDKDDNPIAIDPIIKCEPFYVSNEFEINIEQGHSYSVTKFVGISTNLNNANEKTIDKAEAAATNGKKEGFHSLLRSHKKAWNEIWENADVKISGDVAAQQAIRFNIFQLYQTYTGENEKLNIGPKGFTGEKYGGATYWDTEAYCLPFYLKTSHSSVAKQLLKYRYNQLNKAIENAEKLGFKNGAALFPMVTMNGEECHNEWEITFEEIHRNGAIAYAIYNYVEHTGDKEYIVNYGIEVLVAISRFWVQRFNWSENKNAYVILGVTGPNEYENNVNNNWYTNYIAKWCLSYTIQCINEIDSN